MRGSSKNFSSAPPPPLAAAKLRTRCAVALTGAWLALVLAGCAPEAGAPPAPPDLLPPAELVTLLADLHVAEARAQHAARAADTVQALYQQQEEQILRHRRVTTGQFQRSFAYYAARPAELELIYATLTDTLAMRQVRLRSAARPPR